MPHAHRVARAITLAAVFLATAVPVAARDRCDADSVAFAGFESTGGVRIAGLVAGVEFADIEARIDGSVVASGSVERGAYELALPALAPEAMIQLRVRGRGDEAFIELASHVGTVALLRDEADGDGLTRVGSVATLAVSAETTARYALLSQSVDFVPHECALAAAHATLDADDVAERAAVIKILIEDGGLPALRAKGTAPTTTLGVIANPTSYDATTASIESDTPGRIANVQAIITQPFCDRFAAETLLVVFERFNGQWLNVQSGEIFERSAPGTGTHTAQGGADGYTFTCSGDVAEFTFAGTRVSENYPTRLVGGVTRQVTARQRRTFTRLTRIDSGSETLTVATYDQAETTFPFDPLPAESTTGGGRQAMIRTRTGTPYSAATVAGEYLLPTRGGNADNSANRIVLNADGTGTDLDASSPLNWTVNASGELELDFVDRSARLIPLRDEAPAVRDTLAVIQLDAGGRAVSHQFALRKEASTAWDDAAQLDGGWYQSDDRRATTDTFHWQLGTDGTAPAYTTVTEGPGAGAYLQFLLHWALTPQQTIVLRRCRTTAGAEPVLIGREPNPGECTALYRRREWTLYSADGARYYLHEVNQDWFRDPTTGAPAADFAFSRSQLYGFRPVVPRPAASAAGTEPARSRSTLPRQQD